MQDEARLDELRICVTELRAEVKSISSRLERIEKKLFDDGIIGRVNVIWWALSIVLAAAVGALTSHIGR